MIAVITVINISFAQERLIIKPQGFDYRNLPVNPQINVPVTDGPRVIITPMGSILVDANTRILPTSGNQTELSACIWKGNTNYVFIGANSDPGQGYYYTTNGGTTWGGADLLPGSVFISSDPACIFDNTGRIHFNYFDNIMVCDRSTNGGQNWLGRITVPTPGSFDKNHMAVDDNPSSPYYGKLYVGFICQLSVFYLIDNISNSIRPAGAITFTLSPTLLPRSPCPTGDVTEIFPA